jgi:SagB-type dehydrogenase family enzyme
VQELYRRSSHLVCYWQGSQLVFENYVFRSRVGAAPLTCEILHFFDRWRSAGALLRQFPQYTSASLGRAVAGLVRARLLEHSREGDSRTRALGTWREWRPAASLFHFSTKDAHAPADPEDSVRELRRLARTKPMPQPVKRYPKARQIPLPAPEAHGEFPQVLLARRTWRQFSRSPVETVELATLLGLSFGVQSWVDLRGMGRVALKTSPSGGARHPIEAYVLVLRVRGLPRGLYHYAAGAHRLELLRRGASVAEVIRYLNGQWWFGDAAGVVLMTALFARTQWKYPAPRAYRAILIDAGHVCQTFCLVATWLGLAPFCTMALADSRIERDLGVDGARESVVYAAGVGLPPKSTQWAPWPARSYGTRRPNPVWLHAFPGVTPARLKSKNTQRAY